MGGRGNGPAPGGAGLRLRPARPGSYDAPIAFRGPAAPEAPASGDSAGLTDNLEIRQEMIRLINQTRKANEVPELPVSEALAARWPG